MTIPLPHTWFDWVALLFLLWSALRGRQRGFYPEFYNLLSATVVLLLLAGVSLTSLIWRSMDLLVHDYLRLSRLVGWLAVMGFTLYLLWKIRRWLADLKKRRARRSLAGLLGGLVAGSAWLLAVLVMARMLPVEISAILYSAAARLFRPLVGLVIQ